MSKILFMIALLFFHIVDDYYLQGILASMKQKEWWELHAPNPKRLYRYDYLVALIEHAFSWATMIHIPVIAYSYYVGKDISPVFFLTGFATNWFLHAHIDNMKANKHIINLVEDQFLHTVQLIFVWFMYAIVNGL